MRPQPQHPLILGRILRSPKPQSLHTSNSSSDALASRPPTLKRKHRFSKEPILSDGRPAQIQRRESSVTSTSTASTNVADPTDFSLVKDERDFPTLFEQHKKTVLPEDRILTIPADLKPLRPSKASPYRRTLHQYEQKLSQIPGPPTTFSNDQDELLPDGKFEFIENYILFPGVEKAEEGFNTGCTCFAEGDFNGECDLFSCSCAAQDETQDETGNRQRVIPYEKGLHGVTVLTEAMIGLTVSIYECNSRCNCSASCINRVVQKGRTVRLEIFRAGKRGFGKMDYSCGVVYLQLN